MRTSIKHLSTTILFIATFCHRDILGFTVPCFNYGQHKLKTTSLWVATISPPPSTGTEEDIDQKEQPLMKVKAKKTADDDPPNLAVISRMLPPEVFDIDTKTSLFYFGIDLIAVVGSLGILNAVVTSNIYRTLPFWGQALTVAPLQLLAGFAMWCMWCIGHDAGHKTVSKIDWINRLIGEISHSAICLTPFKPWQKSHRRHHMKHNHLTDDYSHQWFIREERDDLHPAIKLSQATRNFQLPILYLVYLLVGVPDGGHVIFYGKLWEGAKIKEKMNHAMSVVVALASSGFLWSKMGFADFTVVCMVPWAVMSVWLFMVTYLQHHSDDGKLYTDDTFTFMRGAFQTVDRSYGKWVDRMSHHMMDGHVVHHLLFEKVPHYRLEQATKALVKGLEKRNQLHLYKFIDTPHFFPEIIRQFDENWFFINEEQVVREIPKSK